MSASAMSVLPKRSGADWVGGGSPARGQRRFVALQPEQLVLAQYPRRLLRQLDGAMRRADPRHGKYPVADRGAVAGIECQDALVNQQCMDRVAPRLQRLCVGFEQRDFLPHRALVRLQQRDGVIRPAVVDQRIRQTGQDVGAIGRTLDGRLVELDRETEALQVACGAPSPAEHGNRRGGQVDVRNGCDQFGIAPGLAERGEVVVEETLVAGVAVGAVFEALDLRRGGVVRGRWGWRWRILCQRRQGRYGRQEGGDECDGLGRNQLGPSFSLIFIDRRALPRRVSSASLLQPHASLRSGPRETAKTGAILRQLTELRGKWMPEILSPNSDKRGARGEGRGASKCGCCVLGAGCWVAGQGPAPRALTQRRESAKKNKERTVVPSP